MRTTWLTPALLLAVVAGCAQTTTLPAAAARTELAPTGALRVALFTGNPVIASRNAASGELGGTAPILGKTLAADAGVPFVPVEYATVARLVEDAKAGAWDVTVIAVDPARRAVVDYAATYVLVDITYLVGPGSTIRTTADADRAGVRVTAARGAATAMFLERTLKNARLVPAESEPAAFDLIREGKADAYAQNRFMLLGLADRLPGSRVLDDRVTAVELAFALPKGRPAALDWVSAWVERAKASGVVQRAIEGAGIRGVQVAPPAPGRP